MLFRLEVGLTCNGDSNCVNILDFVGLCWFVEGKGVLISSSAFEASFVFKSVLNIKKLFMGRLLIDI